MRFLKNKLINNIISLLILQGSNYIFPLITFPYLVRVLGVENYGIFVTVIAVTLFLNVFVDFGFNISATREISINKSKLTRINYIYNNVISIKILLLCTLFIIYAVGLYFLNFKGNEHIFLLGYLCVVGHALFPIWLYQGIEKMKFITYIVITSKAIVLLLMLLLVNKQSDLWLAMLLQSLNYLMPAIISSFVVKKNLNLNFKFSLARNMLKKEFSKGKYVFMTTLWINFYTNGPLIIIGFLVGSYAAGLYGVGQKIQGAFVGMSIPFTQAIYPHISSLFETNKQKFLWFERKLCLLSAMGALIISILVALFSNQITKIAIGYVDSTLVDMVKLFSIIIFMAIMNTIFSRIMYAMDQSKVLNKSYSIAAVVFLVAVFPSIIFYDVIGMILAVILAEGTILILNIRNLVIETRRQKNLINNYDREGA
ncbi:O-antigen transporter [Shouchella clausii KSM-K16]|uniref:O-antigen transporter n=1 Tax=Shouchella clausii (strain KSM-K16) TaxID=66692 RepID=Q5WBP0_SHOC1|nr:oligosaccharide flippase family protein [Shouchella clausii]BAD66220.1 O-antigen transporter [Shouchella clausii KSM-K16]